MPKILWNKKLSVDIKEFDDDHKRLVDMLNELFDAITVGKADNVVPKILLDLIAYTKGHFKKEEKAFIKYGYPQYEEHKKIHDDFVKQLDDFKEKFRSGSIPIGIPIFNMLLSWVSEHIMKVDKAYTEYLKNAGME